MLPSSHSHIICSVEDWQPMTFSSPITFTHFHCIEYETYTTWNHLFTTIYYVIKKKIIFINATQKFVLLNYCMQRQVTWQPLLCFQWHRNLSCFEGHIHRPLGHKNFKEYFVGGKKCVLWSGKYGIFYIKLQLIKLKCIKLSQTFHTQFPQVQHHFPQTEKFYSILTSLFSEI